MIKEKKKVKAKPQRAVCRICHKKLYSLTTNPDGKIICVSCDRDLNKR